MPQLEFHTFLSQAFWIGITFFLTFMVINFAFNPKIKKIFVERQHNISKHLYKAEVALEACKEISIEMEEVMKDAKYNASELYEKAHLDAKKFLETEIKDMEKKFSHKEVQAFEKLKRHEVLVKDDINKIADDISQIIAGKIEDIYNLHKDTLH